MALIISISNQTLGSKTMWVWFLSDKSKKFGSLKTESPIVGDLAAIYSALSSLPPERDLVFRTRVKSVHDILAQGYQRTASNPLVAKIYALMKQRKGSVRSLVVGKTQVSENDKAAYKLSLLLSGKAMPTSTLPHEKPVSVLKPPRRSPSPSSSPRRRSAPRERLTTGLEEDDYVVKSVIVKDNGAQKQEIVTCSSCGKPINPLYPECACNR